MTIKKKRKTVKRKKRKPVEMAVVTDQPVNLTNVVVRKGKTEVVKEIAQSLQKSILLWMGAAFSASPIVAHIFTQIYCGQGETARCTPIEFHWIIELLGFFFAIVFANAAQNIVSVSAKQLTDALKGLVVFWKKNGNTTENRVPQDK